MASVILFCRGRIWTATDEVSPLACFIDSWLVLLQELGKLTACAAILFLVKTGIFASFERLETEGRETVRQYYTKNAGCDLAGEIFQTPLS